MIQDIGISEEADISLGEEIQEYIPDEEISLQAIPLEETGRVEDSVLLENEEPEIRDLEASDDEQEIVEVPENIELDSFSDLTEETLQDNNTTVAEKAVEPDEIDILPLSNEDENLGFDDIVELNPEETDENDILIDLTEDDENDIGKNIDEEIIKDVDKVFTTRKDDDISESDLDFIDELNNDNNDTLLEPSEDEELVEIAADDELSDGDILTEIKEEDLSSKNEPPEHDILETKKTATPIVPVYDADIPQEDLVVSDPIQQGDTVFHAKYGNGIVEKMIKYGNKTLFSINFDNIGRRLLDPTLTEIKKS